MAGKKTEDDTFEEVEGASGGDEFSEVNEEFAESDEPAPAPVAPPTRAPPPGPPAKGAPPARAAPQAPPSEGDFKLVMGAPEMETQAPMQRLDGVEKAIDEAIRRIDMTDRSAEGITHDINSVKESIGRIEANMRELTSLYDLISSQVNPFIDVDQGAMGTAEEGTAETPSFDTLFEPTPEVQAGGSAPGMEGVPLSPDGPPPQGIYAGQTNIVPGEATMGIQMGSTQVERPLRVARLTQIGSDPTCLIALVRWIEFVLSRIKRDQVKSLLTFYVRIGWISEGIRDHVIDVIRGIRPTPTGAKTVTTTVEAPKDKEGDVVMSYGKERVAETSLTAPAGKAPMQDDWRMTIEDHMKSLIFIERVRGTEVNKDKLEDLERDVENMRKGMESFFGL
jgi:archaeal flagellar protein FlaD